MDIRDSPAIAAICILVAMGTWTGASAPPIRLKASAPSCCEVDLRWTDDSSVGIGFTIERTGDPAEVSWSVVGTTGPTARIFSDAGLSPFTTYYYRVRENDNARVSLTFRYQGTPTFLAVDREGRVVQVMPGYPMREVLKLWYNVMVGDAETP